MQADWNSLGKVVAPLIVEFLVQTLGQFCPVRSDTANAVRLRKNVWHYSLGYGAALNEWEFRNRGSVKNRSYFGT